MGALKHGRTNKRKKGNKPSLDTFCYWDTTTKINSAARLNNATKPNNTLDYGSQGALENRIRSRVFNQTRSVPLLGMGNGGEPSKTWGLRNETEKSNLKCKNKVSRHGESSQIIYWKSKLLVSANN